MYLRPLVSWVYSVTAPLRFALHSYYLCIILKALGIYDPSNHFGEYNVQN